MKRLPPQLYMHLYRNFRYVTLASLGLLLLAACLPAIPTATPLPTLVASLTFTPDIGGAVEGTRTALAPTNTPGPETPTPTPEATDLATPEETPIVVTLPPLVGEHIPPPIDITLPEGWQTLGYDVMIVDDIGELRGIPLAIYQGPVTGGTGTLVLLWGFPNLANPFPQNGTPAAPDLWSDGLRLLRLVILEQGCNIGTGERRSYRLGLDAAVGAQFSAVACPELPDTRGWFAGLQNSGLNFVFYTYVEGAELIDPQQVVAFNQASQEMQVILDTVRFQVPEATPQITPEATP